MGFGNGSLDMAMSHDEETKVLRTDRSVSNYKSTRQPTMWNYMNLRDDKAKTNHYCWHASGVL